MAAISLTPKHFLSNCMIILSLPPSPVSPESGTEIGSPGASSSIRRVLSIGNKYGGDGWGCGR